MYLNTCSSFTLTILTNYPVNQKCIPSYFFRRPLNLWNNWEAHLPFKNPTTELTRNVYGGTYRACSVAEGG